MIANERQYRVTQEKARRLALAVREFDANSCARAGVHPKLVQAEREAMVSQLADLREELADYEESITCVPLH